MRQQGDTDQRYRIRHFEIVESDGDLVFITTHFEIAQTVYLQPLIPGYRLDQGEQLTNGFRYRLRRRYT